MKKHLLSSIVASALVLPFAAQAAETPEHSVTGNLGIFTNYVFRGVTQTTEKPALQGGFDYAHKSGAYAGVWGSNVSWLADSGIYTASSLEMDVYGGYKGSIGNSGIGYDVGAVYYYYPGDANPGVLEADTGEAYAALSWEWLSLKLSYALTDYFGFAESDGTTYVDLSANVPIGKSGVSVQAHVGRLTLAGTGNDIYDYTDWKVGVSYGLPKDFTVGAFYTDTDAEAASYTFAGTNWAEKQAGVYLQKTF